MKNKLNFEKYYKQLDPSIKKVIDSVTKDRNHEDESIVIERNAVESKIINDDKAPICTGWISKATTDHSNDFMVPDGINTAVFNLNPIVFFNHNSSGLPVGKALNYDITEEGVKAQTEFCTDVEFSNDIYKLVKGGFLNSFSIGFIPLQYTLRGENDFNELNSLMQLNYPLYDGNADRIVSKWLLLEYSVVGIPDNWNALITDKSLEISDETIKIIKPVDVEPEIDKTITKVIDRNIKVLHSNKEQILVNRLSDTQKAKIESYFLQTSQGKVLRYSISDIINNKV